MSFRENSPSSESEDTPVHYRIRRYSTSEEDTSDEEEKYTTNSRIINTNFIPTTVSHFLSSEEIVNFALAIPNIKVIPTGVIVTTEDLITNEKIKSLALSPGLERLSIPNTASLNALTLSKLFKEADLKYLQLGLISEDNSKCFKHLNKLTQLTTLKLNHAYLQGVILPLVTSVTIFDLHFVEVDNNFFSSIANFPNLTTLSILGNNLSSGEPITTSLLPGLTQLKSFKLIAWHGLTKENISNASIQMKELSLISCGRITEEVITEIAKLTNLSHLNINSTIDRFDLLSTLTKLTHLHLPNVIDTYLPTIAKLQKMHTLCLTHPPINTIEALTSLTELQHLELLHCTQLDPNISLLVELKSLTYLDMRRSEYSYSILGEVKVASRGYVHFLTQSSLKILQLAGNNLDNEDLKAISHLTNLESLDITSREGESKEVSLWDDKGLKYLSSLYKLVYLDISNNIKITSSGIKKLRKLKSLSTLLMPFCSNVTNTVLPILYNFSSLQVLDVDGCDIEEPDIEEFRLQKSNIKVTYDYGKDVD
jgi:hypothetical protein